jgi:hypothetical protein
MWRQHKKVKQVACDNGNGLLEKSSKHVLAWTPAGADSMRENDEGAPLDIRSSLVPSCSFA